MTVIRVGQQQPEPRKSLLRSRVTPGLALLVILGVIAFRLWVVETAFVEGNSMERSLKAGDGVLILKVLGPKRFDVVLLTDPQSDETVIKRVVGMPGDTISMLPKMLEVAGLRVPMGSELYVNGQRYDEPYATAGAPAVLRPVRIPDGHYYVLGDNRDDSIDSRVYGPVERKRIHGVGVAVIYPLKRVRLIARPAEPKAASPSPGRASR